MKQKPIIGIISACHDVGRLLPLYGTNAHYIDETAAAGGIPMQIPLIAGMDEDLLLRLVQQCDGFLLPGGPDLDSSWYDEPLLTNLEPDPDSLDIGSQETALRLIRLAAASGKPVLGICLGMQVLNVALGGSLYQDIPTQIKTELTHSNPMQKVEDRWQLAHSVNTEPDSLIRALSGDSLRVNSFHHQAVKQPAPGLRVTACAPDGVAEAIENPQRTLLAVQWHPENLAHAGDEKAKRLFTWLIQSAVKRG